MSLNFSSLYIEHKNKELNWLATDSEERFQQNSKFRLKELKFFGWLDKKITYKFNSHGFRCDEFSDQDSIMFLGGSDTLGLGLPLEESWSWLIANKLNLKFVNLGLDGGSADTAFRMCLGYIDKVKPKIVVYNRPPMSRLELIYKNRPVSVCLTGYSEYSDNEYIQNFLLDETNIALNYEKNLLAMRMLCLERNIKFVYFNNFEDEITSLSKTDYARDLIHYGTIHNSEFFNYAIEKF